MAGGNLRLWNIIIQVAFYCTSRLLGPRRFYQIGNFWESREQPWLKSVLTLMVPSYEPLTSRVWVKKFRHHTPLSCPLRVWISFPVFMSHNLISLSWPPLARILPSKMISSTLIIQNISIRFSISTPQIWFPLP